LAALRRGGIKFRRTYSDSVTEAETVIQSPILWSPTIDLEDSPLPTFTPTFTPPSSGSHESGRPSDVRADGNIHYYGVDPYGAKGERKRVVLDLDGQQPALSYGERGDLGILGYPEVHVPVPAFLGQVPTASLLKAMDMTFSETAVSLSAGNLPCMVTSLRRKLGGEILPVCKAPSEVVASDPRQDAIDALMTLSAPE